MVEKKLFESRLEKNLLEILNQMSPEDFQKYLYAVSHNLPSVEEMEIILQKLIKKHGLNVDGTLKREIYDELCKMFNIEFLPHRNLLYNIINNSLLPIQAADYKLISVVNNSEELMCDLLKEKNLYNIFSTNIGLIQQQSRTVRINLSKYIDENFIYILSDYIHFSCIEPTIEKSEIIETLGKKLYEEVSGKIGITEDEAKDAMRLVINNLINNGVLTVTPKINLDKHKYKREKLTYQKQVFNGTKAGVIDSFYKIGLDEKRTILKKMLEDITYQSASSQFEIIPFHQQRIFTIADQIVPTTFMEKITSQLPSILNNAMSTYYMFLSGNEVTFYDEDNHRFKFPIDDLHILGLERRTTEINRYFQNLKNSGVNIIMPDMPEFLKTSSTLTPIYSIGRKLFIEEEKYITTNNVDNQDYHTDREARIKRIINVQNQLTTEMVNSSLDDKIEMLVYFYNKENGNKKIRLQLLGEFNPIINKLREIIKEKSPYFGNGLNLTLEGIEKKTILDKFISIHNDDSKRTQVIEKYEQIEQLQEYLRYKTLRFTRDILLTEPQNTWNTFFEDKSIDLGTPVKICDSPKTFQYSTNPKIEIAKNRGLYTYYFDGIEVCKIEYTSSTKSASIRSVHKDYQVDYKGKRELLIYQKDNPSTVYETKLSGNKATLSQTEKKLNKFALADLFIQSQIKEQNTEFQNNHNQIIALINLFKIYDKLLYLNSFNYVLDINEIYIGDVQDIDIEHLENMDIGITCEMEALRETLLALFNDIDENGTTHFISIQNTKESTILHNEMSPLPQLYNFKNQNIKTMIGMARCNKNGAFSNIISQNHNDYLRGSLNPFEVFDNMQDGKIKLKFATSNGIESSIGLEQLSKSIDNDTINVMTIIDILERNILGIVNVLAWTISSSIVDTLEFTQLKKTQVKLQFMDMFDNDTFAAVTYKVLVQRQMQENLSKIMKIAIKILDKDKKNTNQDSKLSAEEKQRLLDMLRQIRQYTNSTYNSSTNQLDESNNMLTIINKMESIDIEKSETYDFLLNCTDKEFIYLMYAITTKLTTAQIYLIQLYKCRHNSHPRIKAILACLDKDNLRNQKINALVSTDSKYKDCLLIIDRQLECHEHFNKEIQALVRGCEKDYLITYLSSLNEQEQLIEQKKIVLGKELEHSLKNDDGMDFVGRTKKQQQMLVQEINSCNRKIQSIKHNTKLLEVTLKCIIDNKIDRDSFEIINNNLFFSEDLFPLAHRLLKRIINLAKLDYDLRDLVEQYEKINSMNRHIKSKANQLSMSLHQKSENIGIKRFAKIVDNYEKHPRRQEVDAKIKKYNFESVLYVTEVTKDNPTLYEQYLEHIEQKGIEICDKYSFEYKSILQLIINEVLENENEISLQAFRINSLFANGQVGNNDKNTLLSLINETTKIYKERKQYIKQKMISKLESYIDIDSLNTDKKNMMLQQIEEQVEKNVEIYNPVSLIIKTIRAQIMLKIKKVLDEMRLYEKTEYESKHIITSLLLEYKELMEYLINNTDQLTSQEKVDNLYGLYKSIKIVINNIPPELHIKEEIFYMGSIS